MARDALETLELTGRVFLSLIPYDDCVRAFSSTPSQTPFQSFTVKVQNGRSTRVCRPANFELFATTAALGMPATLG